MLRVIAGEFRSRLLQTPPGLDVRPTPDRLKEALFNVLQTRLADVTFVDAYAGSGAVGIEALSRGARRVVFLEKNPKALQVLRANLKALGLEARAQVVPGPARKRVADFPAEIVFLDPPYRLEAEYEECLARLGDRPPPLVIAQHPTRLALAGQYGQLMRHRVLKQGDNALTFYTAEESGPEKDEAPADEAGAPREPQAD
jgi:16S rRNA (guanine(966)-N(2))-methyltransferase RsmD